MSYILIAIVRGLKYFVQYKDGEYILNGLEDNAKKFTNECDYRTPLQFLRGRFKNIPFVVKEVE